MLTYMQVHFYYTLPPTIILYLLMRPLLGSYDKMKIIALCAFALIYTTPWVNIEIKRLILLLLVINYYYKYYY